MAKLCVNVDHVATVREARKIDEPDPVAAAMLAELAGAHGITVHLRGDRRHIQDRDLEVLRRTVRTRLNLELAVERKVIDIALRVKPDMVTFVPERREEVTTEGGLDAVAGKAALKRATAKFNAAGIGVSLFIDPKAEQIRAAKQTGAEFIELNTAKYSEAADENSRIDALAELIDCCELACSLGLRINAGHGLNYRNVGAVAAMPEIEELNIGHSIIGRAILVGMKRAVRDMLEAMERMA